MVNSTRRMWRVRLEEGRKKGCYLYSLCWTTLINLYIQWRVWWSRRMVEWKYKVTCRTSLSSTI